jgi:uncharacterized protein YrrD
MKTNYSQVLLARNRTKQRCNVYYYEAMGNIARYHGFTASEFLFGCAAMAMKVMKCDTSFLTNKDNLILNNLRVCIAAKK